jgi:hypothetical protein
MKMQSLVSIEAAVEVLTPVSVRASVRAADPSEPQITSLVRLHGHARVTAATIII